MKHEKLSEALNEISDSHIAEASQKKQRHWRWVAPVAAVLAVAIIGTALLPHFAKQPTPAEKNNTSDGSAPIDHDIQASYLLAKAQYPKLAAYPAEYEEKSYDIWWQQQRELHDQPKGYADSLEQYWGSLLCKLMEDSGDANFACSPVNIYMALAMLTETAGGESRQQLLELLNADSIEQLRQQAGHVWKGHYNNDGLSTCILSNSLWLKEGCSYDQKTIELLADSYYTSTFQGDLGSDEMNKVLQAWLDEQTGGLLTQQAEEIELDPRSVLALASTVYYQVQWRDEFRKENNTEATFHGTAGDTTETFMNRQLSYGPYFWSDNFGAVYLSLEDGSQMWLVLPDEGVTPAQLLESGEVTDFLAQHPDWAETTWTNQKNLIVNLSVPKFDVSSSLDLCDKLKELGVTDIFGSNANFTPIMPDDDAFVGQINHAARVGIDEKGVTAAAFTVIDYCGAGMPPEEEMDFVLDRPFLFLIESQDGLPLFAGIVNQP